MSPRPEVVRVLAEIAVATQRMHEAVERDDIAAAQLAADEGVEAIEALTNLLTTPPQTVTCELLDGSTIVTNTPYDELLANAIHGGRKAVRRLLGAWTTDELNALVQKAQEMSEAGMSNATWSIVQDEADQALLTPRCGVCGHLDHPCGVLCRLALPCPSTGECSETCTAPYLHHPCLCVGEDRT